MTLNANKVKSAGINYGMIRAPVSVWQVFMFIFIRLLISGATHRNLQTDARHGNRSTALKIETSRFDVKDNIVLSEALIIKLLK